MEKNRSEADLKETAGYTFRYDSPLGIMTGISDGEKLCGLWFSGQKYFDKDTRQCREEEQLPVFQQTKRWLDCYFSGGIPGFLPPLLLKGTDFRMEVWEELMKIPYGKTVSYGKIAAAVAEKRGLERMSAQAVGGAVGHNPISIIVPCHRVIGADGSLTGYGGGLDKKIALLSLEGAEGVSL